ncbi:terminase large subunit [Vibrio phage vB_VpaP_G1]|uniref:Terminase large subunit n=1 Tax=Vibrio phage vB_VpaP_G1 TaxID=2862773 RepID=A0AAE8BPR6_9CAUD|nr:terminase large subunit [Vibrio phage vB_VpaP_G1]QYW05817.1 terminase large subunit [Vibrio phage vB_VpaP_G1]
MLRGIMEKYPDVMSGGGVNGDQGIPIEPRFLGEEVLQKKERDQGPAWFQLQHMLNTRLMDAERYPLKSENIIGMPLRVGDDLPLTVKRGYDFYDYQIEGKTYRLARAHSLSDSLAPPTGTCFYIDPAGGGKGRGTHGGDESGWACTSFLNGNIFIMGYGGVRGGYDNGQMHELIRLIKYHKPTVIKIEQNFGYGAFRAVFMPLLREEYPDCEVLDDFVTGQKETRIIDTLEPIIARGSLIMAESAIKSEPQSLAKHPDVNRITYCMMYQMNSITRDRDSLIHDDRLDALAGSCSHWEQQLMVDQKAAQKAIQEAEEAKFWQDPLNHNRYTKTNYKGHNMLARRRNKR